MKEIDENIDEKETNKRIKLLIEKEEDLELLERLDAESRRFYDPIIKTFDHAKKRATDLAENAKLT